ncbi:MAG: CoA transferase subunit A [Deltaproteobacteria bacterium]|nr:CoA transferase subunit A [Deltaproteobacteria bacterium]
MDKVTTATEAISMVQDGALVAINFWGPGSPKYLWQALVDHTAKDLSIYTNNFWAMPDDIKAIVGPDVTSIADKTIRYITGFADVKPGSSATCDKIIQRVHEGSLKFESLSHGIFMDKLYAGAMRLGGFYSPIGVGTVIEEGKEKRVINGAEYLFESPIIPDVGLVKATTADTLGNLVYTGTARGANPVIAMASKYTIAEVFDIVKPEELDPERIGTPGIFIDKIVKIPEDDLQSRQRRMELVKLRIEYAKALEEQKSQGDAT